MNTSIEISEEYKQQYIDEGYFILENAIPDYLLDLLQGECQHFIDLVDARMDEHGTDVMGLNHRNKRYFSF